MYQFYLPSISALAPSSHSFNGRLNLCKVVYVLVYFEKCIIVTLVLEWSPYQSQILSVAEKKILNKYKHKYYSKSKYLTNMNINNINKIFDSRYEYEILFVNIIQECI